MSDRSTWEVKTHHWGADFDRDHLQSIHDAHEEFSLGGRRHMILEVLAYANDEAESQGRIGRAIVTVYPNGSCAVADNGRGTDTRRDSEGLVIRKPVMSTKDVRFFGASDPPLLPDGLPRRGISTVSALSALLIHDNFRATEAWSQTYRNGIPEGALRVLASRVETGTRVMFHTNVAEPRDLTVADLEAFAWLRIDVIHDNGG